MANVMPHLKRAVDVFEKHSISENSSDAIPILSKLDVTRDLRGSFFAINDWKKLHDELASALEYYFSI